MSQHCILLQDKQLVLKSIGLVNVFIALCLIVFYILCSCMCIFISKGCMQACLRRACRQCRALRCPSNVTAICASVYHTIHSLTPTLTLILTLISSYLTNKHRNAQRNTPAYWMTSRLREQSAAQCKNCLYAKPARRHFLFIIQPFGCTIINKVELSWVSTAVWTMNLAFQILVAIYTSKSYRDSVATGRAGPYFRPLCEICQPSPAGAGN